MVGDVSHVVRLGPGCAFIVHSGVALTATTAVVVVDMTLRYHGENDYGWGEGVKTSTTPGPPQAPQLSPGTPSELRKKAPRQALRLAQRVVLRRKGCMYRWCCLGRC